MQNHMGNLFSTSFKNIDIFSNVSLNQILLLKISTVFLSIAFSMFSFIL